jgi:ribonuclease P protein component
MLAQLTQSADFERVLGAPSRTRSPHFALHHLAQGPLPAKKPDSAQAKADLSTGTAPACPQVVDNPLSGIWIGCVVPKRHAKRAVTRSLLKRQIRHAFQRHAAALPAGQWLVRLRAPFAPSQFISARSELLAQAARSELDALLHRAAA